MATQPVVSACKSRWLSVDSKYLCAQQIQNTIHVPPRIAANKLVDVAHVPESGHRMVHPVLKLDAEHGHHGQEERCAHELFIDELVPHERHGEDLVQTAERNQEPQPLVV